MNLNEKEERKLTSLEDYETLTNKIANESRWIVFDTRDALFVPLSDAPILVGSIRDELPISLDPKDKRTAKVSSETSDETLCRAMETTKCCLKFPENEHMTTLPVADTAFRGVFARVGLDCAVTTSLSSNARRDEASPYNKGIAYDALREYTKGKSIIRVCDEMIRADLSEEYVIIPANEVFEKAKEVFFNRFERVDFMGGIISHETESFVFQIFDAELEDGIFDAFNKVGIDVSGYGTFIKVLTSDVGLSGINVYPFITNLNGNPRNTFPVAFPYKLEHRGESSLDKFEENLKLSFGSFLEFDKFLDELQKTSINNPADTLYNIGSKLNFIEKGLKKAAEDFDTEYPFHCSGLDVFVALSDIFEGCQSAKASDLAIMQATEGIMKACKNIKRYDEPTIKIGIHSPSSSVTV